MARRKELRTVTKSTTVRIEFTLTDLRKRLRLPDDAELLVQVPTGNGEIPQVHVPMSLAVVGPLTAEYTRTSAPREEASNA